MSDTTKKFQRRADARPDEVLDAALQLFTNQGFEATRVEDIAKRAGISKATVYLYFPSKIALLEGLVRRSISPVAEMAHMRLATFPGGARQAISMVLTMACQKITDPKVVAIPVIVMREGTRFPEIAQLYHQEVLSNLLPALTSVIKAGIAAGEFRAVDPELTVRNIVGPLVVHVLLATVFGIGDKTPAGMTNFVNNHLDVLMNGLCKGAENE